MFILTDQTWGDADSGSASVKGCIWAHADAASTDMGFFFDKLG